MNSEKENGEGGSSSSWAFRGKIMGKIGKVMESGICVDALKVQKVQTLTEPELERGKDCNGPLSWIWDVDFG